MTGGLNCTCNLHSWILFHLSIHQSTTSAASESHLYFHLQVFKDLPQVKKKKKKRWFSCTLRARLSVAVSVKHMGMAGLKSWQSSCTVCRLKLDFELPRLQAPHSPSPLFSHKLLHAAHTFNAFHCAASFFLQVKLKKSEMKY